MSRRSWLVPLVFLALSLPVAAQSGPTRYPLDFTNGPNVLGSCGSFDILESDHITGAQLVWFDANKQPLKAVTHLQAQVIFTNSLTGQSVTGFTNVDQTFDVPNLTQFQHGLAFTVNLPQRGTLYVEAGTVSINFITGQFTATPAFFKDIGTPLCSALS